MAVKPEQLQNRAVTAMEEAPPTTAEQKLQRLQQRIRAAANEVGKDPSPKGAATCDACFQRGWMTLANHLLVE